jgi:hypothetical protein
MTFKIVKYKGVSNWITQFGKTYIALPGESPKSMQLYAEYYEGKFPNVPAYAICNEAVRDLEVIGEVTLDYADVKDAVIIKLS